MALERELKFRLSARAASEIARALAVGAAERFVSIYFDTPDHVLRRARVALRLRRAGRRSLQAVKCDLSPLARGEWQSEAPLGRLELARFPLAEIRETSGVDLGALAARLAKPEIHCVGTRNGTCQGSERSGRHGPIAIVVVRRTA